MIERYFHDILIAVEAILTNKLKSALTALGIIFGVAAVISMLAIGNGAQQEILEQIKLVGVNNIVITPVIDEKDKSEEDGQKAPKKFSKGLSMKDVEAIEKTIPSVKSVSPEIILDSHVIREGKRKNVKLFGVTPAYFDLFNIKLEEGMMFSRWQIEKGAPVCLIGMDIKTRFFSRTNPVGQFIKCGKVWLKVIGIIEERKITIPTSADLGFGNSNSSVFVPIKTMLMRYENRGLITGKMFNKRNNDDEEKSSTEKVNNNQLDRITVQVKETEQLLATKEILNRMILRRHSGVSDFTISVPELLLKQQQRTKDIFNIVLGAIAGISLIVGGIGIMNIMLASVLERIKEIGTRMAIGATKKDIIVQFLAESTLISLSGGFFGIILGVIFSKLITKLAGILTIITPLSVIVAFGVSVSVGIVFGYLPAKRASKQDPVVSLRN